MVKNCLNSSYYVSEIVAYDSLEKLKEGYNCSIKKAIWLEEILFKGGVNSKEMFAWVYDFAETSGEITLSNEFCSLDLFKMLIILNDRSLMGLTLVFKMDCHGTFYDPCHEGAACAFRSFFTGEQKSPAFLFALEHHKEEAAVMCLYISRLLAERQI